MNSTPVTRIEFFGGPEDGRVLDAEALQLLAETPLARGPERIPMLIEVELNQAESHKSVWAGSYIAGSTREGTLVYHWTELDA
jgi:hypothetical protein